MSSTKVCQNLCISFWFMLAITRVYKQRVCCSLSLCRTSSTPVLLIQITKANVFPDILLLNFMLKLLLLTDVSSTAADDVLHLDRELQTLYLYTPRHECFLQSKRKSQFLFATKTYQRNEKYLEHGFFDFFSTCGRRIWIQECQWEDKRVYGIFIGP